MTESMLTEIFRGVIESFDDAAGLGVVRDENGSTWPFHCISILDGSRTIEPGRNVEFALGFRGLRTEAVRIRPGQALER